MTNQFAHSTMQRPVVTFVIIAFNQGKYIREAIEAAFAQTYQPLEIILSDDYSSDTTYDIMQRMALAYKGPHNVIARRNKFNAGTALHVQYAFEESSGELLVIAAGDDISTPDRVTELTDAWISAGCPDGAIHSGREIFRDNGTLGLTPVKRSKDSRHILEGFAYAQWLPAAAPTCAYTRGVFDQFDPLIGGSLIEDAPLFLRSALLGEFIAVDKPLVRHRIHDENNGTGYDLDRPARWNSFIQSKIIAFRTMQRDLVNWQGDIDFMLRQRIERRILSVLHSSSHLILPETCTIGRMEKVQFAFRLLASLAVASSLRMRIEYTLGFFGFTFHLTFKNYVRRFLKHEIKQ